ncbi:N-6 DNA methylase [Caballeronia novacaledonica]|uniref:N-6 DNA methylase n=1 Tax=Caballeronia novacaledonica TaxID=1544861 RepID=UPI001EE23FA9|nr:type I restriction-modification system subunit M/S [Caballeronia novacaledonica]GJH13586.1 N-6 DNA methylase [Caballeronia novacaledonica]
MDNKIVWQLVEIFRGTLSVEDALELTLQILVWIRLSDSKQVAESAKIDAAYAGGLTSVTDAFHVLAAGDPLLGRAFERASQHARASGALLTQSIERALRARDAGILDNLDIPEVATYFSSWREAEMIRPKEVVDLLIGLSDLRETEVLYAPWDFRAQLGARAVAQGAAAYIETPLVSSLPVLVALLAGGAIDVHFCDSIRSPSAIAEGRPTIFPVAAAFPPFGVRYDARVADEDLFGRFPEKTQSGNVLWIRHLLSQSNRRTVVAVTNNVLSAVGAEKNLREDLIRTGRIKAIIALPAGLMPNTTIPFSILVLDPRGGRSTVRFINANTDRFCEQSGKSKKLTNTKKLCELALSEVADEDVATVPNNVLLENDAQLQVTRYVIDASEKKLQAMLASAQVVLLGDLVTTIRPLLPSKDSDEFVQAFEIGAADIPPFGYVRTSGRPVNLDRQTIAKGLHQFLRPFDIVLIVKGSIGKVGIVSPLAPPAGEGGWVAGQSAIVLRKAEGSAWDPRLLLLQLRSPVGQQLFDRMKAGASIPMIQLRELTRLPVIVPSLEDGRRAAQALEDEETIQKQIDELRNRQSTIAADLWTLD